MRYKFYRDSFADCHCDVEEDKAGSYVLYEDYEALQSRVAELERRDKHANDLLHLLILDCRQSNVLVGAEAIASRLERIQRVLEPK